MGASWSNWLGNHRAKPGDVATPRSIDDVVQVVDAARVRRQRLRVLGAGYSWSPLVPVDGTFVSTRALHAVRNVDRARCQITVETGMVLRELVDVAARNGMSVKSPTMFLGLSVGGLIATGSHGTGRNVATFGDAVVGFELVTASGEVIRVDTPGSDLWRAVIANLGTLGVLTAVTLQCEPLYNVHEAHIEVHVSEVAAALPKMLSDYEFVSLFWYPSSNAALFKVGNRSTLPAVDVRGRLVPTLYDHGIAWLGKFMPAIARTAPFLSELVGGRVNAGLGTGTQVVTEPAFSHYQQAYPRVISSEFAIPVDVAPDAWTWAYLRLMQYCAAGVRPVNLVVHARFTGPSASFLASSAGRATCHMEVLSLDRNKQRDLFQGEYHAKMHHAFGGRAHWGKDIANHWQAARGYGEGLDRFLEVRHELDPDQRFLNPFLRDEVFGLGRRVVRPRAAATTNNGAHAATPSA